MEPTQEQVRLAVEFSRLICRVLTEGQLAAVRQSNAERGGDTYACATKDHCDAGDLMFAALETTRGEPIANFNSDDLDLVNGAWRLAQAHGFSVEAITAVKRHPDTAVYAMNRHGFYAVFEDGLDVAAAESLGIQVFDTIAELHRAAAEMANLDLNEVEGHEFVVRGGRYCDDRGFWTDIPEQDIDNLPSWFADFEV